MNMVRMIRVILLICAAACSAMAQPGRTPSRPVPLQGWWRFELDPLDAGEGQQWFKRDLQNRIQLPGILQAQDFGNAVSVDTPWVLSLYDRFWYLRDEYKAYTERGKVKIPFLSQPPQHYLGAAWYQRDIQIPPALAARRLVLTLERPHWETTVWLDDRKIGSDKSLVAPHVFDLGTVGPGRHRLTVRVDNRMILPYRPDAHSVSDSLGGSWNGIVGRIELNDTGQVWIDDVQVYPDLARKTIQVKVRIGNITGRPGSALLTVVSPSVGAVPVSWNEAGGAAQMDVPLGTDAETWDEFHPKLHRVRLWLNGADFEEYKDISFGLRDFRAQGKEFTLNGRPVNFRGTHHGGDFPLTGYPPTDVRSWKALFQICQAWGLNHMRFHSWCPPEAAFQAADELGFYLQPEPGMWNEISPGTPMEKMLYEETDRMIKAYGNHPSFLLLSASNEPKGRWQESLPRWVAHYRQQDARRLYASGTGHTEPTIENITEGTDYLAIQRIGPLMLRRESAWFGRDYGQSLTEINIPVISHEVGQWVAYPDYDVIKKFRGYLRPGNFEIFRESMAAQGLLEKNKDFAAASGRFQLECYKEEIEANLRTPGLGGFQLLDLHDFLGQGTALVGLLDPFWESKGYVSASEFKQFCNTTVPLARVTKRIFTNGERFTADVEIAHFGSKPLENARTVWAIGGPEGGALATGEFTTRSIPIGKNIPLGRISADLSLFPPGDYSLTVTVGPESVVDAVGKIRGGKRTATRGDYFQNSWNFWVYPERLSDDHPAGDAKCPLSPSPNILVTRSWEEAEKKLASGGRVLFIPLNSELNWTSPPLDNVPVFWNRQMGPAWGRMLGLLVERRPEELKSAALSQFPTKAHFDWQWASMISNVRAINLDRLPAQLEPTVWAIDDWNRNYKLGVLFECTVGDGKLLVSAFDVSKPGNSNPVARRLRYSLLNYISSDCFQPKTPVLAEQIRGLFFDNQIMKELGAVATVNGESAKTAIDGDPNTFVLVGDRRAETRAQVEIKFEFPAPVTFSGLVLMPRQNHREHEGDIRQYSIQISDDGEVWREAHRGELLSTFAPQQIVFSHNLTTRYLKLISISGFGPDKMTALAELALIYAGPKLTEGSGPMQYQRNRTATPEIDEGSGPDKRPTPAASPKRP